MLTRRAFVAATALAPLPTLQAGKTNLATLPAAFAHMEQANGGRFGVSILDTATGERTGHRADERFPMCSTFKFLLATAVLHRVDHQQENLDRAIAIPAKPLLSNSPLTEPHAGATMSIDALCHAALTRSDNTAANLLLETLDGPAGLTKFARSIGDPVTRLDRNELSLNECLPGDPRDTTSPRAMVDNLHTIVLGNVLRAPTRDRLTTWMKANLTGVDRLRARLPEGWLAADKTGTNGSHTSNDIAVFWPAGMPPIIVAAYLNQCPGPESKRAAALAEIGWMVQKTVSG